MRRGLPNVVKKGCKVLKTITTILSGSRGTRKMDMFAIGDNTKIEISEKILHYTKVSLSIYRMLIISIISFTRAILFML
jgi:hypothetical protein